MYIVLKNIKLILLSYWVKYIYIHLQKKNDEKSAVMKNQKKNSAILQEDF